MGAVAGQYDDSVDRAEDAIDHPWVVVRRTTPPVIGWYEADTGEPYMYYYTGAENGSREPVTARPPSTVDLPEVAERRWTDDDGTEVKLTM